jgi:diguanylate cyclase (GGDEF)-like protein
MLPRGRPMKQEMDSLTDLLSPEAFVALLEREELRRSRTGEELAVAVLDVDGLRAANAAHGAAAGTEMLRVCVDALQLSVRAPDELARTGPDEFSILLHATDAKSAIAWEERFEETLDTASRDLPPGPVTCAVGMADTTEAPTLMDVAVRARRRMEVIQTVRKLRRARETGT